MFYTPPTSPSAFCSSSPFKTPPRVPSPGHWDGEMTREVYLKSDSDFDNPDGALSSLLLSGCSKPRDVFIFPSRHIPTSERDKHVLKIAAKLNNLKSPNKAEKSRTVLNKVANWPQTEIKKIKVIDLQWAKNLDAAVEHLLSSSLERGFENTIDLSNSQTGPRVPILPTIYDTHTPEDSLRIERYLKLCKFAILINSQTYNFEFTIFS